MNAETQIETVRRKVVWGTRIRTAVVLGFLLATSCSQSIRTGQASSYLVITSLTGGSDDDSTVESDVVTDTGSIFTDAGQAQIQVLMKDNGGLAPSPVNAITITQYHVEYVRSDGRNTPGVDVPFAFDGGVATTITSAGTVGFTLVRIQAKLEAPLKALALHGGAQAISTVARITFYGHDQTGREVSVTGNIDVTFADWAG
jgi:hypothetical protein